MENAFVLLLVGCTSLIAYEAMTWNRERKAGKLQEAIGSFLEWIGAFTLFFIANLMFGIVAIFLIRTFTQRFVALYTLENILLWVLSAAQAYVFLHCWKRG